MSNLETLSGSEIGRRYAPETIVDKEGWGRKFLRSCKEAGLSVMKGLAGLGIFGGPENLAKFLLTTWLQNVGFKDYKAPHAPRGTPARPLSRYAGHQRLFKGHRP